MQLAKVYIYLKIPNVKQKDYFHSEFHFIGKITAYPEIK
jgi:hypothetical protein